jgi:hypothetical protein
MRLPSPVKKKPVPKTKPLQDYDAVLSGVVELLDAAHRTSARAVNSIMTASYWEVGRRIVEFEQGGEKRAGYGEELLARLAQDLSARFGRGFSRQNLQRFRTFYLSQPTDKIRSTLSSKFPDKIRATTLLKSGDPQIRPTASSIFQTSSGKSLPLALADLAHAFPLPWSHYVELIGHSRSPEAFAFYQAEALRGGWSVRQLRRQMDSQFYERTALSKNKTKMLQDGTVGRDAGGDGADAVPEWISTQAAPNSTAVSPQTSTQQPLPFSRTPSRIPSWSRFPVGGPLEPSKKPPLSSLTIAEERQKRWEAIGQRLASPLCQRRT